MLRAFPVVLGMAASPVGAQGIFKCVDGDGTAYQSMPCANGQAEMRLAIAQTGHAEPASVVPRTPPSAAPSPSGAQYDVAVAAYIDPGHVR